MRVADSYRKQCMTYAKRGLIKILGAEGDMLAQVQSKTEAAPVAAPVEAPAVPVTATVAPGVAEVITDTVVETEETPVADLSFDQLKEMAEALGVTGKSKKALIKAITEANEAS